MKCKESRCIAGSVSAFLMIVSIGFGVWGFWEGCDSNRLVKSVQAAVLGFWIIAPPVWFWFEYFFIFKAPTSAGLTLDEFKHGQDQSAKIWLAFVTVLAGLYFGADLVPGRPSDTHCNQKPVSNLNLMARSGSEIV